MVHRVSICSNLKSPFVVQQYDQLEGYNSYNHVNIEILKFCFKETCYISRRGAILATTYGMFSN